MLRYKQFKEAMKNSMPVGVHVYDKKISTVDLMIHKEKNLFVVYVDGEKLDSYETQREAERMGKEFIKQAKV
tara:strand:+ start:5150 stop:5365 length:216 start_codon:yes stop_codon:yes gene_type:complete